MLPFFVSVDLKQVATHTKILPKPAPVKRYARSTHLNVITF